VATMTSLKLAEADGGASPPLVLVLTR
jgi:hypothetical protein